MGMRSAVFADEAARTRPIFLYGPESRIAMPARKINGHLKYFHPGNMAKKQLVA
jgi:hypothetical protein